MAIFQREGDSTNQAAGGLPASGAKQTTIVAKGSRVKGEISGATDVLVDGQVEGQLILGSSVVIGEGGQVLGQIQAQRVKVGGKVTGDIQASERIEVMASGRIEGDVSAPRVAINAGAFFKGKVEMTSEEQAAKPAPPKQPEAEQKRLHGTTGADGPPPAAAKAP